MQNMPIPSAPMEFVGIDTVGPLPRTDSGNEYICTIVDHFSGWPEAFAIPDKKAETIARVLLDEFLPRHGCPRVMLSDQGTEYCNAIIDSLSKELGISRVRTSSFHAQTNGKTERFHRVLNEMLGKRVFSDQSAWDQVLHSCLAAYRVSKNETTKYTPYFLLYGRDPVLPIDTLLQPRYRYHGDEYVPQMFENLHNAFKHVTQNIQQSQEHNKALVDRSAQPSSFQVGDPVYYFDPTVKRGDSTKLTLYWKPHFRIVSKLGGENYVIKNQETGKEKLVHSENLRAKDIHEVWDRNYTSQRKPMEIRMAPESEPRRVQPPRGAKHAYGEGFASFLQPSFSAERDVIGIDNHVVTNDMDVDQNVGESSKEGQGTERTFTLLSDKVNSQPVPSHGYSLRSNAPARERVDDFWTQLTGQKRRESSSPLPDDQRNEKRARIDAVTPQSVPVPAVTERQAPVSGLKNIIGKMLMVAMLFLVMLVALS